MEGTGLVRWLDRGFECASSVSFDSLKMGLVWSDAAEQGTRI